MQRSADELFWDESSGGWFGTTGQDPTVLLRMKEDYDGAEPSASSVSVLNLIVLSHLHDDPTWDDRIEKTLRLFGQRLEQIGRAVPMMAAALSTYAAGLQQIVIAGDGPGASKLFDVAAGSYRPFSLVLTLGRRGRALATVAPFLSGMHDHDRAAYCVCPDFTCRAPVTTPEALARAVSGR